MKEKEVVDDLFEALLANASPLQLKQALRNARRHSPAETLLGLQQAVLPLNNRQSSSSTPHRREDETRGGSSHARRQKGQVSDGRLDKGKKRQYPSLGRRGYEVDRRKDKSQRRDRDEADLYEYSDSEDFAPDWDSDDSIASNASHHLPDQTSKGALKAKKTRRRSAVGEEKAKTRYRLIARAADKYDWAAGSKRDFLTAVYLASDEHVQSVGDSDGFWPFGSHDAVDKFIPRHLDAISRESHTFGDNYQRYFVPDKGPNV